MTDRRGSESTVGYTQSKIVPLCEVCSGTANECKKPWHLRNVIRDELRQLPDDEAAVGGHTRQAVTINSHVADDGEGGERVREREQGTVTARTRDDANTAWSRASVDVHAVILL